MTDQQKGIAPRLINISQAQQERLFHIDFKLRFLGSICRADLVTRFGIKEAAATRDLSLYKTLAPKNLVYDTRAKTYIQSVDFKPVFYCSPNQALAAISSGLGDNYVGIHQPLVSTEAAAQPNAPQIDLLAQVIQAIHQKRALQVQYRSLSSGLSTREIVPFALVDNGLRWHVRAYDRKRERFTDFVINRIAKPKLLNESTIPANETKDADIQWNRIVEMHLVPHPRLQYPETIEYEYGMQNGMLKVNVRAAVAGYVLRRWNVDCSENHCLTGAEYHLWLKNRQTLYGVENLVIAPGYAEGAQAPQGMDAD
ncbi:WYL domain-containing protein [Microbulbifer thermotolerans]|uniref:WYL domain-containing protein n=1 Tax=Microbulbifer thermotolerans TaxID=252514 RepID=A0AB35I2C0_MICTH|nr:WYL domain-containing protein [Microbulbifer thermotolerans]MCX2803291.1 WYL domain-containing protein [Microbulbifer thermotolerans]